MACSQGGFMQSDPGGFRLSHMLRAQAQAGPAKDRVHQLAGSPQQAR